MRTYNRETAEKLENTIIRVFIREALQRGHTITVTTYGEDEITRSNKINKIVGALRSTDYDNLRVHDGNKYIGGGAPGLGQRSVGSHLRLLGEHRGHGRARDGEVTGNRNAVHELK